MGKVISEIVATFKIGKFKQMSLDRITHTVTLGFRMLKFFRVCDKLLKFLQHAGQPGQLNHVDLLH